MRYEDASSSFQASGPIANDDSDTLPAGSRQAATGNLITGEGTQYGSAGADTAAGGHITAIAGKGGEDSSFAGGRLSVSGEHGNLSVDAEGNYSYLANKGAPENVRDRFTYTLADNQGNTDTAALVVELGKTPVVIKADAQQIVPGPDGVVTLPPGVELSDIMVVGRNLVVNMPDGTQLIILDGAVFVPQLVLDGVQVPATNVAALLIGQEPQPAAGELPPSSGGNFALPPPPLDPGVPLGDLIPPTVYDYIPPEPQEVFNPEDDEPVDFGNIDILIDDDTLPSGRAGGVGDGPDAVNISGLLAAIANLGGDPPLTFSLELTTAPAGFALVSGGAGIALLQQNGVTVRTITFDQATGQYNVTQNAPILHPPGGDENDLVFVLTVTVTDSDGDTATGTVTITYDDDTPGATQAQVGGTVDEDGVPGGIAGGPDDVAGAVTIVNGSVVGLFESGADGPLTFGLSSNTSGLPALTSNGVAVTYAVVGNTLTASAGGSPVFTLVVNANGSYTFTLLDQIDHPTLNGQPGDNTENDLSLALGSIVQATDADGDSVTAPANGLVIVVDDDTPVMNRADIQLPSLTVDETDLGTNASGDFSVVFSGQVGADGPGTTSYAVATVNGTDSGLVDVATGDPILLFNNAGVVEGRVGGAGGAVAFTVAVNSASGVVTLDQVRAVEHSDPTNPDDSVSPIATSIQLTATITDADSDSASLSVNIGNNLVLEDDGPSISASTDQPSLTVDETDLAANASASFAGVFTSAFGADGAGTIAYALGINAGATGLFDVATGQPIVLVLNGGVVEGHVGNAAGPLAFTVSIDANSGVVTLDQIRALTHPDFNNPDDSVTLAADNLITVTGTVTDRDGDQATAVANIGQNLNFEDDGPSISAGGVEPNLTVDETNLAINAAANFAALFTSSFGADGAGVVGYSLIVSAPGVNSGLIDVATGLAIVLVQNGTSVEGHVGNAAGALAFTVSVDGSGNVTLDQIRAVQHPDASNPDDSITLASDDLIALRATIIDRDGDSTNASVNIGQNLNFEDDGPSANPDTDVTDQITDTAVGNVITGVGTTEGPANADAPGADGFGSITNLVGFGGSSDSDPAGGFSVNGQFGTLQMDANGQYTYTRTGGPGGAVETFTYTYVDGDGDPASATLTITLADDAPVAGTVNVGLDDDALAGGNPGGIGDDPDSVNASGTLPGSGGDAPLTFGVLLTGAPAGFSYVSGGSGIVLVQQGGVTVLTVTVGTNGSYSVVQNNPIDHAPGSDENNQDFTITYTVTDADTDVANGSINISVDDDTPTVSASGTQPNLTVDETILATNASASFAGVFTSSFGADGAGTLTYALAITGGNGVNSGLIDVATGQNIVLVNNGGVIEGHVGSQAGALAFTVSVNGSGVVTLDQIRAVTHPDTTNPDDSVTLAADNLVTLTATITDGDSDQASATANIGQNLIFEDDGPSISAGGAQPNLTVDETNLAVDASASFAGVFTSAFGADGAGTVTYALSILSAGAASGLVDVASGQPIILVMNGSVVEGRVGNALGAVAFTVTVDGSGNVTLDQLRAVVHPNTANPDDSVTLSADNLVQLTATVTDRDGDSQSATANIGQNLNFEDDGPSAAIVTTGQGVSVDESAGIQIDSNDTTAPAVIALFAGVGNVGVDPNMAAQYAQNASAIVASTGSTFGADGAGTVAFSLNVSAPGVDSGLDTTAGQNILLFKEGNLIVGRVSGGPDDGDAAFALAIDPSTGVVSMVEYLSIKHPDATNPDDSVSIANGALLATATVTDRDGDTSSQSTPIGSLISFQDAGPIMTAASNINIQNSGDVAHTGTFAFDLGADGAAANNNVLSVTGSATVNGAPVTNYLLTETSENAVTAVYSLSFDYPTGGGATAHATGTVTFDKANGTYTVDMDAPIQGISIVQTATGTDFTGYDLNTSNETGSQPDVAVTQLRGDPNNPQPSDLFIQFTSIAEPGSGTGADNLETTQGAAGAFNPVTSSNFGNLELFTQEAGWVSASGSENGVNGDTVGQGEVLDFNLFQGTNPTGFVGGEPTATASTMFLKFDGITNDADNSGNGEDLIVILKLYDPVADSYTTKALIVQNTDIQKGPGAGPGVFSGVTLDNNDGLIVIEPNDYQEGNTNLVIVGAQIVAADEGVTGTGINFNNATGGGGASTGTEAFSTDNNDGPLKITSIGFLTTSTTNQNAHLDFNVTVTDGDGDSITQAIAADITQNADSSTPIVLAPAVTQVGITSLGQEEQLQKTAANSNTLTLAAAVAAAGIGSQAAANDQSSDEHGTADDSAVTYDTQVIEQMSADDGGDAAVSMLASEPAAEESADADSSSSSSSDEANGGGSLDDSAAKSAPESSDLPAGEDGASHSPADAAGPVAPTVSMPSAEALEAAANDNGNAQQGGSVEQIVADALAQGDGQAIDELLAGLPGGNGEHPAIANMASPAADAVSSWDMGSHGAIGAGFDMMFKMDVAMHHQDAVQPVANG